MKIASCNSDEATNLVKLIDPTIGISCSAFNRNNKNYVGLDLIVVPKMKRKQGLGSKSLEMLSNWADTNNIILYLSPSNSFGATSTSRLVKFYKRFGFVFNKGSNKDWTISDLMIRYPKKQ